MPAVTSAVQRFDVGRLVLNGAGGARIPASIARTGIQIYHDAQGREVREYRPPEEVFSEDSLASLASVPVTVGHPGLVGPDNWKRVAVGHVAEAAPNRRTEQAAEWIEAPTVISDGETLAKVQAGELVEVSMGYTATVDPTPGTTPTGERYDAIQRRIRFNHLALLRSGHARAGTGARLRLDSKGNQQMNVRQDAAEAAAPARTVRVDGVDCAFGSETHVSLLERSIDTYKAGADDSQQRLDAASKELGEAKAKLDAAEKRVADLEARDLDSLIQDELDFRDRMRPALPKNFEFAGKSREDVQRAVVGSEVSAKIDSLPEAQRSGYLAASVDAALETAGEKLPPLHVQKADASDDRPSTRRRQDAALKPYNDAYKSSFGATEEAK